jgi:hypothetical protein
VVLPLPIEKIRCRNREPPHARKDLRGRYLPNSDQPVALGKGEGAEQDGMDQTEDCAIDPDAKCQDNQGNGSKSWSFQKHAGAVFEILEQPSRGLPFSQPFCPFASLGTG